MLQRKLYNDKSITAIGLGTSGTHPDTYNEQVNIIRAGLDAGANLIDTAESYIKGISEKIVGEAINKGYDRDKLCICSKVSPEHLKYHSVINSCEQSLRRLNTDYLDIYYIHWPNNSISLSETLNAMSGLMSRGIIKGIGLSNFSFSKILEVYELIGINLKAIQMEYNILERGVEKTIIPFCDTLNIPFVAYTPLCQGSFNVNARSLTNLVKKHDKSVYQVVLRWILRHSTTIAIPKSSGIKHTIENINSASFDLSEQDCNEIDCDFTYKIEKILPKDIVCKYAGGYEKRVGYTNLKEAFENKNNLIPNPLDLARELLVTKELLKPIQVSWSNEYNSWELINGNGRYWGWVIAFGDSKPIDSLIVN